MIVLVSHGLVPAEAGRAQRKGKLERIAIMQNIRKFYRGIDVVAVGMSTAVCASIPSIKEMFTSSLKLLLLIPLILAIAKLLSWFGAEIFERITILRKLYFGNKYIEGVWFGDNGSKGFSLTKIIFDRSGVTVTGEQFDNDGNKVWRWSTLGSATFADSTLLYFSNSYDINDKNPILGVSNMIIHKGKGGIPSALSGYWSSIDGTHKEKFDATKIVKRKQLKILNKNGFGAFIKWFLENKEDIMENNETPEAESA